MCQNLAFVYLVPVLGVSSYIQLPYFGLGLGKSMGRRPKSPPQGLKDVLELSIWLICTISKSFKSYSTSLFWVRLGKSMGRRPKSPPQGLEDVLEVIFIFIVTKYHINTYLTDPRLKLDRSVSKQDATVVTSASHQKKL